MPKNKKTKLRIGFLLDDTLDKPDGVQQYVTTLGEYLRSMGHDVHYLVAKSERTDLKNVHPLARYVNLRFNHNNVRTPLPTNKNEIAKTLAKLKLDVLHVQMPYSPYFAARVINLVGPKTKVVGTFHILPASRSHHIANKALGTVLAKSLNRFDHFVAVSKPAAEFARNTYKINCGVVPNAVDLARFKTRSKASNSIKRVVFLGRFVKRKGPLQLVRALAVLRASGVSLKNVEVIMGGKGPDHGKIVKLARELGLSDCVSFPGFIDEKEKAKLLASADIAVFPSLGGESFGIVLVEAMASGAKVVLGGNNPGYSSVLGAKPELLFDPSSETEFAAVLKKYLKKSPKIAEITKWQKSHVKQFDVPVVAERLMKLYTR